MCVAHFFYRVVCVDGRSVLMSFSAVLTTLESLPVCLCSVAIPRRGASVRMLSTSPPVGQPGGSTAQSRRPEQSDGELSFLGLSHSDCGVH